MNESHQYICYFHDYRDYCTEGYNESTEIVLSMMNYHDFVCQFQLENNHFISSQLKFTEIQNDYLSIHFGNYSLISTKKLQIAL